MRSEKAIRNMKIIMILGLALIILGHYLLSYTNISETYGIKGLALGAGCVAVGLIMSLPTKMYLTFLFVTRENESNKALKK